jgi:DNA-binding response OmpR family regulator
MAKDKHTVLLVDDDQDLLFQQRVQLEAAGYDTVTASSLKQGRKAMREADFDVAVVDLMMEELDAGFSLCHELKRAKPNVPVILQTAVASETGMEFDASTKEEKSWVKADLLLPKPVRFEQLEGEIKRLLAEK